LKNERKKVSELSEQLNQVTAECGLLRRENGMYEQKCVEMDRDRQKMYLVMFRKGQQAASSNKNQKFEEEEEMDEKTELQVVTRFLHDAFFYYLLSKGSAREHLQVSLGPKIDWISGNFRFVYEVMTRSSLKLLSNTSLNIPVSLFALEGMKSRS